MQEVDLKSDISSVDGLRMTGTYYIAEQPRLPCLEKGEAFFRERERLMAKMSTTFSFGNEMLNIFSLKLFFFFFFFFFKKAIFLRKIIIFKENVVSNDKNESNILCDK